jgi:ribosomal protein S18 acetylase RimI-like enzyme
MHVVFRTVPYPEDCAKVERIVRSTGFFSEEEIAVARELVSERLRLGVQSGYHFIFADTDDRPSSDRTVGYTCFGRIPGTEASFDLYWVAVQEDFRHGGLGTTLLEKTEKTIVRMGGCRLYAETSSIPRYESTRAFYTNKGFREDAILEDFYANGDAKVIYVKMLPSRGSARDRLQKR